jgi:protein-tyrosine-phosphatase/DNA-binding transcriptional ArsR family regulator
VFLRLAGHPLRWRLLAELAAGDLRVRELVRLLDQPQNLLSYHLRLLRDAGLVTAARSSYDRRDSYYHLDLDRCAEALAGAGGALHPALLPPAAGATRPGHPDLPPGLTVLWICTGNSARSPIAEALLRHHTGGRVSTLSAGTHPGPALHPDAVRVLRDGYGLDLAGQRPRHLDAVAGRRFDYVITLCDRAREQRPEFGAGVRFVHWSIPDPVATAAGRDSYPMFRSTAAELDNRVRHLLPALATVRQPSPRQPSPREV